MKERLKEFIERQNLNARQFAEILGVQPSSISHILTGRNKPGVELLEKMLRSFPELDIHYIITGIKSTVVKRDTEVLPVEESKSESKEKRSNYVKTPGGKQIERIVIFNNDGSFTEYTPS